jgi:antitoxin component of RelBE/YafQ-DinJ toxin-antitoxin module
MTFTLVQTDMKKGLPFVVEIPNKETCQVLNECEQGIGLNKCKNADDFFTQLGI